MVRVAGSLLAESLLRGLDGEKVEQFRFELGSSHHGYLGEHFLFGWRSGVLPFLAGFRSKSSLKSEFRLLIEKELILLELSLEA